VLRSPNATEPSYVNSGAKDWKVQHGKQDRISTDKLQC
jgi:hypothetical protein